MTHRGMYCNQCSKTIFKSYHICRNPDTGEPLAVSHGPVASLAFSISPQMNRGNGASPADDSDFVSPRFMRLQFNAFGMGESDSDSEITSDSESNTESDSTEKSMIIYEVASTDDNVSNITNDLEPASRSISPESSSDGETISDSDLTSTTSSESDEDGSMTDQDDYEDGSMIDEYSSSVMSSSRSVTPEPQAELLQIEAGETGAAAADNPTQAHVPDSLDNWRETASNPEIDAGEITDTSESRQEPAEEETPASNEDRNVVVENVSPSSMRIMSRNAIGSTPFRSQVAPRARSRSSMARSRARSRNFTPRAINNVYMNDETPEPENRRYALGIPEPENIRYALGTPEPENIRYALGTPEPENIRYALGTPEPENIRYALRTPEPENRLYALGTPEPENRLYALGTPEPENRLYALGTPEPENRLYALGTPEPENRRYALGTPEPENRRYGLGTPEPENIRYALGTPEPENRRYALGTPEPENIRYALGIPEPENRRYALGTPEPENRLYALGTPEPENRRYALGTPEPENIRYALGTPEPENIRYALGNCPICLDPLGTRPVASTGCGHCYCRRCIWQHLRNNILCPTCRRYLTINQVNQLYLQECEPKQPTQE